MANVDFAKAALVDLVTIADDLSLRASVSVAQRYASRFNDAFDLFERHPGLGAPRPELGVVTRLWTVPPYAIFYDQNGSDVIVLRVLHGSRKIMPEMLR